MCVLFFSDLCTAKYVLSSVFCQPLSERTKEKLLGARVKQVISDGLVNNLKNFALVCYTELLYFLIFLALQIK